jgi:hypothetical protein
VGLDPDSLFSVTLGGVDAQVAGFTPVDPERPEREATLLVWAPPPAPRRSAMALLGFAGGVLLTDTVDVAQRDLFEPNDTLPHSLGTLPNGFRNPALALEARLRDTTAPADQQPADWYTFDNPVTQDRTVAFGSEGALGQAFGVILADSLEWNRITRDYAVGPGSWAVGIGTYLCAGLGFTRSGETIKVEEVLFPLSILAIRNLPAGRYHVLVPFVPFGTPTRYELVVLNSYTSVLAPDGAEENDYCDVATPLNVVGSVSGSFTVDNPHDVDWFRFTIPGGSARVVTVRVTAQNPDADLDLYLARDFRPDSLYLVQVASRAGPVDSVTAVLASGDYFLVVVDFQGQPTAYALNSAAAAGSAVERLGGQAVAEAGVESALAALRAKSAERRGTRTSAQWTSHSTVRSAIRSTAQPLNRSVAHPLNRPPAR